MAVDPKPAGPAPTPPAAATPDASTITGPAKPDGQTPPAADGAKPDATAAAAAAAPAGDVKPDAAKPAADAAKPAAAVKYTLAIPDGAQDWLDPADLSSIENVAKTKGWTNEEAQAAVEEHADTLAAVSAAFREQTEADPIYGGEHLENTQRLARLALDKVRPTGTPHGDALRRLLVKTGYGNNLEVVSLLADLGKLMAEDTPGGGHAAGGAKKGAAEVLYGASTPG